MLRRGLRKGIIKRYSGYVRGKKAKYFYYLPSQEHLDFGEYHSHSYILNKYKDEKPMCDLKKEKDQIKLIINNIAETHNLYINWEKGGLTDVEFVLELLKLATAYEVRNLLSFHGQAWVEYIEYNLTNNLGKKSSGSFYTSLIDFDNYFQDSFFDRLVEQNMLEPTDERVEELSDFASEEYDKLRSSLYTLHYILDRPIIKTGEALEITGIPNGDTMSDTDDEEIEDIPGFEGTLDELNNLTSEFKTYIGAPGNEIG
jgi:hypothetical protein